MDENGFKQAYAASRNGTDHFYRHWFIQRFQYSDGVRECAEAGCYWLLDIVATEVTQVMARFEQGVSCMLTVTVAGSKAKLTLTDADDKPALWKKDISMTDLPPGEYIFLIVYEGRRFAMTLLTEY